MDWMSALVMGLLGLLSYGLLKGCANLQQAPQR